MADQKYPAHLYDANGQHVSDIETDEDVMLATAREGHLEVGGKIYIWNQRNGQWRESAGGVKVGGKAVEKVAEPEPEPAKK